MKGSKRSKKMSIFYLMDGNVVWVGKKDIDFDFASKCDWAIIALNTKDGKLVKLSLINLKQRKVIQEYTVNEALIHAFEYDITRGDSFLKDFRELEKFFVSNVEGKNELREKTKIKKFMFLIYYNSVNAKKISELI